MTLKLSNRSQFINTFLLPLSRVSNACILKLSNTGITTLLSAADNTVILYGQYKTDLSDDVNLKINIPDIQRLMKVLQCVNVDNPDLDVGSSQIKYSSDDLRFTYHLLDDGIISIPPLSIEKIKDIQYDTTFRVPYDSVVSLLKSSTFTLDINKLYFFTKEGSVYAEINDKQAHNVDSICIKLCDEYKGDGIESPLPVSLETVRTLAGLRCDGMTVRVNAKLNVMTFSINIDNVDITYIVSGLIK